MIRDGGRVVVVVTGAAGWIGRALVPALESRQTVDCVPLDRSAGDLAETGWLEQALRKHRPKVVVHLAASLQRGEDLASRQIQWRDTFLAGRNLVEAAGLVGIERLIMAGSLEELGGAEGVLSLDLPARPMSTYGLCKTLLREVAAFYARKSRTVVEWFRPTIVYGPGQRGSMLIPAVCEAARRGIPISVTDGRQIRDFLYIDDLVDWIARAVFAPSAAPPSGLRIHHVGSGVGTRVRDVVHAIERGFDGAQIRRGARRMRQAEPESQIAPRVGTDVPGWRPRTGLDDGMARTIAWWREMP